MTGTQEAHDTGESPPTEGRRPAAAHVDPTIDQLEKRVDVLEQRVAALVVAVDMASRMRIATPDHDIRIVGGKKVRRAHEKGGLVNGYPETSGVAGRRRRPQDPGGVA